MATWNSRGLRGSALEEVINATTEEYRNLGLAIIQKIPTPITPMDYDRESGHITLAYFEKKSTVDYMGAVQGVPVCFDAKECAKDTVPIANFQSHQIGFMSDFERQGGIAFILLYFSARDEYYYVPYRDIRTFWDRAENGGRKSFTYDEIDRDYAVGTDAGLILDFLEPLQKDLFFHDSKM